MRQWLLTRARSWRTWACLFCVAVATGLAGFWLWTESHLRAAQRALDHRAFAKAEAHLDRYFRVWPHSEEAHLLAARCARLKGDFATAARHLDEYEQLGADRDVLTLERYLIDAQRGTLSPAQMKVLRQRSLSNGPDSPHILEALALGFIYTNRLGEAKETVDYWLALTPGESQPLFLRGLVWEGMGNPDNAGQDYRDAIRRDPQHVPARKRLAEHLLLTHRYGEAAELFDTLLREEPHDAALRLGRARCHRHQGETAEAEALLDALVADDAPLVAALVERARIAQVKEAFADADKWYRQALALDPFDSDACFGLARCLRHQGKVSEAKHFEARWEAIERDAKRLKELHAHIATHPTDIESAFEAGTICQRNGQREEARRWFRNVLQRDAHHAGAREALEEMN